MLLLPLWRRRHLIHNNKQDGESDQAKKYKNLQRSWRKIWKENKIKTIWLENDKECSSITLVWKIVSIACDEWVDDDWTGGLESIHKHSFGQHWKCLRTMLYVEIVSISYSSTDTTSIDLWSENSFKNRKNKHYLFEFILPIIFSGF